MFDAPNNMAPVEGSAYVALPQSPVWLMAAQTLGASASLEQIHGKPAIVIQKHLPLLGTMALLSRVSLNSRPDQAAVLPNALAARHVVVNAETGTDASTLAAAGFHRIAAPRPIAELELASTPAQMADGLAPKWRNRLRRGLTNDLCVQRRTMPPDPGHWLFQAEARQARRLRYRPLPPKMIVALSSCKPGTGQLFTAYYLGQRVAAMLFLRHGRAATYQIGWNSPQGRAISAGPALMWKAMVDLQQFGVTWLDLGYADPVRAPGLSQFKLGTGARIRLLGGSWSKSPLIPNLPFIAKKPEIAGAISANLLK